MKMNVKGNDNFQTPDNLFMQLHRIFKYQFDVELQVLPRSGHTQRGIVAQFGTIDSSYRGEIWVTLFNFTDSPVKIEPDERVAQLVVCPIFKPDIIITKELSSTDRGDKGFGSTGNK